MYLPQPFVLLANTKVHFHRRTQKLVFGECAFSGMRTVHMLFSYCRRLGSPPVWLGSPSRHNHKYYCLKGNKLACRLMAPRRSVTRPARLYIETHYGADTIICSNRGELAAYKIQNSKQFSNHNSSFGVRGILWDNSAFD